jgi:hypothetical protein
MNCLIWQATFSTVWVDTVMGLLAVLEIVTTDTNFVMYGSGLTHGASTRCGTATELSDKCTLA